MGWPEVVAFGIACAAFVGYMWALAWMERGTCQPRAPLTHEPTWRSRTRTTWGVGDEKARKPAAKKEGG